MGSNLIGSPYAICKGSLLTRNQYDRDGRCIFELWIKSNEANIQLIITDERPVCFATLQNVKLLQTASTALYPSIEFTQVKLKTFADEDVYAIYVNSLSEFYQLRQSATQQSIELLEADVKPVDRYLMERFIQLGVTFTGVEVSSKGNYQRFEQVKVKSSREAFPMLKAMSIDIECDENGYLFSIGIHAFAKDSNDEDFTKVLYNVEDFASGIETDNSLPYVEWLQGERALLQRLNQIVMEQDPDCLIGWNFVAFDIHVLSQAATRNHIKLKFGRDNSRLNYSARRADDDSRMPARAYAAGRVVLDGIEVMKNATYHFNSFALDAVASELLGERKLISNVDGLDKLAEIKRQYREEPLALAKYNLQDCVLVSKIFKQEKLLEFLLTRSQLTGLELERLGGSVAAFTNLYLPQIHRKGWIAPNLVNAEDYLHSPGGFVMDSKPGMHDDILVFDFKSLYPSIIRTFNVDPIALQEGVRLPEAEAIPGFRGGQFSRETSILATIVDDLWTAREKAKKQNNTVWSNAIKIIMNSFYGVLGSAGCRFYDTRLASSITMRGHWILAQSKIWFEEKGLDVIYGDTDSIFVSLHGSNFEPKDAVSLEQELNTWWDIKIQREFKLHSRLEIEFESHFSPFFMPTIRGMEKGSKKRYAGMKLQKNADPILVFKGMESVRSDWTDLAKEFQTKLFQLVFNKQPVTDYLRSIIAELFSGNLDNKLVYRKKIRQHLNEYVKTTPPQIKAAKLANNLYGHPKYRRGSVIPYVVTIKGPQEYTSCDNPLHYQHYLERQLFPIASAILENISPSELSVFDRQMTLNW
ncbi:DNA polymerase II [Psychrosphaera sp. 1_MG-2023]|uniref:DNA polymerase II n=1 Tax=Psychrosphaera sp. 1_MG-2023 TaxID=3062643 RepID=UPI0026E2EDF2|nr:DNA polymerase II [Psychrosphaera sp. 1_MG-2023]MDO6718729.1 DNA polymerase II [Psychrosphaera sp. 1_MG-2023]